MLIKNNEDRLVIVQPVDKVGKAYEKPIILFTGWNEIPANLWEMCLPSVADKLGKQLEIKCKEVEDKDADGKKIILQTDQALWDVRADMARDMVRGCYNIINLEAWAKEPKLTSELRALVDIQLRECIKGVENGERV